MFRMNSLKKIAEETKERSLQGVSELRKSPYAIKYDRVYITYQNSRKLMDIAGRK